MAASSQGALVHMLSEMVKVDLGYFSNTQPAAVPQARRVAYATAAAELSDLWPWLIRITGKRDVYGKDEATAEERLRLSSSSSARQLAVQLPAVPRTRWPWMDDVDVILGRGPTKPAPLGEEAVAGVTG